ncbi:hypothetical protein [Streptococcus mutans]|jgi:hypothetical protein|uniref:Uncharacterized protein n=2 Tax=Streptococcus mutans TaxID=1309 RepID=A0AAX1K1S6_STRMG|nr:hypothetical protein [Streptococcus mutans]EMB55555.1 hypothetical protein SMU9_02072 [Streptococcus mutans 1ID3]EMB53910.1 hypothetical protein SMU88_08330 [Streptococcus mutans NLML8]EMB62707.1 hypothetical protein SMU21_03688 [Streptococcus mutans 1SM1]EMB64051.1 hypothetical protein SMU22_07158 [Streptococcus mutans 4SM1]EMB72682.1 hypothetical protein SMU36_04291 [Streptococcus mutans 4VF1]
MNNRRNHLLFLALYVIIAVVTWFIKWQVATVIFGLLALNALRLYVSDKKNE